MRGSLNELGWIQTLTLQEGTDVVVDGHERAALALSEGETRIPAVWVDLTDEETRKALLMLDSIAGMAVADKEKLSSLLAETESDDSDVQELLRGIAAHHKLAIGVGASVTGPESFPSYDESIETEYRCPKCEYEWSGKPK